MLWFHVHQIATERGWQTVLKEVSCYGGQVALVATSRLGMLGGQIDEGCLAVAEELPCYKIFLYGNARCFLGLRTLWNRIELNDLI